MKKITVFVLVMAMLISVCSCARKINSDGYKLKVGALNGPTGMGMAKLIEEKDTDGIADYELFGAPEEIRAKLLTGKLDVAAIPSNLASVIINKTEGKYLIGAINTLGVLYIVENGNTVKSLSDLNGKVIYATGQGSTPEYILNHILSSAGVTPSEIIYKTEHSELATLLASEEANIALLPEPFVTSVISKNANLRIAVDLTSEWSKYCSGNTIQGVIVISKSAAENHRDTVNSFLDKYSNSVKYVNEKTEAASETIASLGIVGSAEIAKKSIPNCNIVFIEGKKMVEDLTNFFTVLYNASPASVGGIILNEEFYYKR